jgi:hypothetical protein
MEAFYIAMTKLVKLYVEYLNATNEYPDKSHYSYGKVGNFTQIWFHINGIQEPIRFQVMSANGSLNPKVSTVYSQDHGKAIIKPKSRVGYVTAVKNNYPSVDVFEGQFYRESANNWVKYPTNPVEFGPGEQAEIYANID